MTIAVAASVPPVSVAGRSPANEALRTTLLARARDLVPRLRQRTQECEEIGRVPDATIDDLTEAGLLRVAQPGRFGGAELGWDVVCEVDRILAHGCASQAWINNIMSDHAQQLGTFPLEAQEDVWGKRPKARVCGSLEPVGCGKVVPGGVMFSGRHAFGSGVDHADWVVCGGFRYEGDRQLARAFFLVPKAEIEVLDDWKVLGLGGTGSKSFVVKDVFVPDHRIMDAAANETDPMPGSSINTAAIFRLPRASSASSAFASLSVGIAEACLDTWLEHTAARRPRGVAMSAQTGTQLTAGLAAAEIKAASYLALDPVRQLMATLEAGLTPSVDQLREVKLAACHAATMTRGAVQRLAAAAGARAMYDGNILQRQLRDVMMATAHFSLNWDMAATAWAQNALDSRAPAA
jgi:3-hydroxy-9,10-secoandrosta-1,3,5(10)-triene-9,17-dione monooxygenase